MKTRILVLFMVFVGLAAHAQIDDEVVKKNEQKLEAKRAKEKEAEMQVAKVKEMLAKHRFVLEADYLSGRTGMRNPVSSSLNFIRIDSATAVIQVGSNNRIGSNGVGGVTAEGKVTKYELQTDKKNNHTLRVSVSATIGFFDLVFYISSNGHADADLHGNWSGSLTFSGELVSPKESRTYKGSSW